MLVIRLQRIGKKHQPSYRIVVAEAKSKVIAPPREDLGSYDPRAKRANINADRANYWISVGAQPSVTVHNLFVRESVLSGAKRAVYMAKPKAKEAAVEAAAPAAEAPAEKPAEEAAA